MQSLIKNFFFKKFKSTNKLAKESNPKRYTRDTLESTTAGTRAAEYKDKD